MRAREAVAALVIAGLGPARLLAAEPAFELRPEVDAPVLAVATVFTIGRGLRGGLAAAAYCAPECDPSRLNGLDRHLAGRYHPGWSLWSNVGLYGMQGLAVAGLLADEGAKSGLNDVVVIAESALIAHSASGLSTAAFGRPRPYMYGSAAPLSVRQGGEGGLSFFSGHSSTAFATALSAFATFRKLHPARRWPWLILGGGLVSASFVAAARVLGGFHFPTDVLAGAVVGSSIGLLVPALHAGTRRVVLAPMLLPEGGGVSLVALLPR